MKLQKLIQDTLTGGDMWLIAVAMGLALLLLLILLVVGLVRLARKPGRAKRKAPPPGLIRQGSSDENEAQNGDSVASTPDAGPVSFGADQAMSGATEAQGATESIPAMESGAASPAGKGGTSIPAEAASRESKKLSSHSAKPATDMSWVKEIEVRPVAISETRLSEPAAGTGRASADSAGKDESIPAAWREEMSGKGGTGWTGTERPGGAKEALAPILDLESQRVDSALISIPEYPVPIGQNLTSARKDADSAAAESRSSEEALSAVSREDGLFDVYRNVAFLRTHLKSGLDPADLFFSGMGGDVAANSHPYVLFLPEFAHDPEIRRKTESILQTAASGYMQRGLDRLANIEREALSWTLRFLFWKGRLDKAISLLYRFEISGGSELGRIRSLLAACLEDSLQNRIYGMSDEESAGYDRALLGIPSPSMRGLRSSLAFQAATDTEDLNALRPLEDLDRRNVRWVYLQLLHRGHLFQAFRLCHKLSFSDSTFEDECIYLAGVQGRYRLVLKLLLEMPARNRFFRLSALKHALAQLDEQSRDNYLKLLRNHWPEASQEALESVEPFAEFQGADTMRRSPGNILGSVANPMDRSALLDWMDLAAYRSRAGFHAGALNRAAVLLYTVLRAGRQARPGFEQRADRFFKKASQFSGVARHYYVLWLKDRQRWSEARNQAEYFVRRYPDLEYFQEQFVSLSRV